MIDTSEVDPIAEAEVYMAYGRDVQAEEILKDAIAKEPKRHELHLKLLEIFATRKDSGAFETLAGELYAALGATDPTWAKVAEIGRKFEPDNPLYVETATHAKADVESTGLDSVVSEHEAPVAPSEEFSGDVDIGLGSAESSLDFSLDEPAAEASQTAGEAPAESNTLDFDIGGLEMPAETPSAEAAEEQLPDIGAADFDLDISAPQEAKAEPALEAAAEEQLPDIGAADFDLDISAPQEAKAEPALEVAAGQETAGLDFQLDFPEPAATDTAKLDAADLGMEAMPDLGPSLDQPAEVEEISLDVPMEDSLAESVSLDIDLTEPVEMPPVSEAVPDIDQTAKLELPAEDAAETSEITLGSAEAAGGLDFNFDLDVGESAPQAEVPAPAAAAPVADIDLSGISLDIDDGMTVSTGGATDEISLSSSEDSDVDTKLDLVTAYVDMGDKDGARELLQEVLKEGGPVQREKAQKLMASLG
jgi:pilus assembly protein FimV